MLLLRQGIFLSALLHRPTLTDLVTSTAAKFPRSSRPFSFTMCIQWCCKNCPDQYTKLTHRWARERCNEFFIARSRNERLTACPNGPWEFRRAYHRHPYRGAQVCETCKKTGRKEYKVTQSARQQANVALGERAGYTGTIYLGELEIPETFHDSPHVIEARKLDAMRSNWESFSSENGHLPVHELEREWASRFAAFDGSLNTKAWAQEPSKLASTFGRPMSEGVCIQPSAVNKEEVSRSPDRRNYCIDDPSTNTRNCTIAEKKPCAGSQRRLHPDIDSVTTTRNRTTADAEPSGSWQGDSTAKRATITTAKQEAYRSAHQPFQYNISSDTEKSNTTPASSSRYTYPQPRSNTKSNIDDRNIAHVEEEVSRQAYPQFRSNTKSNTDKRNITTVEKKEPSRDPHREALYKSNSTARSSSSQSTRARPWDL